MIEQFTDLGLPITTIGLLAISLAVLWRSSRNQNGKSPGGGCGDCRSVCPKGRAHATEEKGKGFSA
jgi:epoxyqueuosine reductase QueG